MEDEPFSRYEIARDIEIAHRVSRYPGAVLGGGEKNKARPRQSKHRDGRSPKAIRTSGFGADACFFAKSCVFAVTHRTCSLVPRYLTVAMELADLSPKI